MKTKFKFGIGTLNIATIVVAAFFIFVPKVHAATDIHFYATQGDAIPDGVYTILFNDTLTNGQAMDGWVYEGATYSSFASNWLKDPDPSGSQSAINAQDASRTMIQVNTTNLEPNTYVAILRFHGYTTRDQRTYPAALRVTYTVTAGSPQCVIQVGSTNDGVSGAPSGGFNYTLSGSTTINGSGANTFYQPADAQTWTITYTGGTTEYFSGYTPARSQSCSSGGGNITFTLNFLSRDPSACRIDSFAPDAATVDSGTSTMLRWATTNCTNLTISGGAYNNTSVSSVQQITTTNLTQDTTFTLNATNGTTSDSSQVTVRIRVTPCTINTYTVDTNPVAYDTGTTLRWTTSNCNTITLNGGIYNNSNRLAAGSAQTGSLTTQTTYTLRASGGGTNPSASITVSVDPNGRNQYCTIRILSMYNGAFATPPGSFNFRLSGPVTIDGVGPSAYSESPSVQNWTITYTGGSNSTFTGYSPASSQSCSSAGSSIDFVLNFQDVINPPGNPKNENSTMNGAVACNTVSLSWTSVNANSYTIYRSTDQNTPGSPFASNITGLNYTDSTGSSGTTYYYWGQAVFNSGSSALVRFAPFGIQASPCEANLNLSNKIILKVNDRPYHFSSSCRVPNQSGTFSGTIKKGDKLLLAINICNTGTLDVTNVSVSDDLTGTNLTLHSPPNITMSQGTSSVNGNSLTFSFGNIAHGANAQVTFEVDVTAPAGNTQNLLRFRNVANMTYGSALPANNNYCSGTGTDAAHACPLSTGYVVFYNGLKTPSEEEVAP